MTVPVADRADQGSPEGEVGPDTETLAAATAEAWTPSDDRAAAYAGVTAEPQDLSEDEDSPRGLIAPSRRGRSKRLIGDVVVDLGFARRDEVEAAVATAREQRQTTGQVLIESGLIRHDQLARALAERYGVDHIDLSVFEIDMGTASMIDIDAARRYQSVPVAFLADNTVLLAMADPTNVMTLDEISMITGRKIRPAAAAAEDIAALLGRIGQLEQMASDVPEEPEPELEVTLNRDPDGDAPIVRLVHSVIARAVELGASDIHFNRAPHEMKVLFRVDGVLSPGATIPREMAGGVVSRIKIMATLDISERRVPQDGRLAVTVEGRRIDARVVTLPLVAGEGVVMRILDSSAVVRDLDSLGMRNVDRERFSRAVTKPHGAVLVTGPTGSGKSTTLYSALAQVNDGQRSIITIEDPVESQIAGIKQMQVSVKAGVTFATGLRSILRADPDVIMVGEIRDRETAEVAIQAALTGHLVLSTLHTRDAASAISRLIDIGIEPFMVASAIDCVIAQRLARRLCQHCKTPASLPAAVIAEYGLEDGALFDAAGCIRCGGTGYSGRLGLYETMPMTEEIRTLALERAGVDAIRAAAIEQGMRSMHDDGIDKVRHGLTTLAEVGRVTQSE